MKIKINSFMNIASCNIKTKAFSVAIAACEEVLKLSPDNTMALYRRARATALPINAGVPDLRRAIKDLDQVIKQSKSKKGLKSKRNKKENKVIQ